MFKVEIKFKKDLKDIKKYTAAVDEIFKNKGMPCTYRNEFELTYGDNGDTKDFGRLMVCVGNVSRSGWIVDGLRTPLLTAATMSKRL